MLYSSGRHDPSGRSRKRLFPFALSIAVGLLLVPELVIAEHGKKSPTGFANATRVSGAVQPDSLLFQLPISYGTGADNPFSLAIGDVNGDGKPDLVVANQCAGPDWCGVSNLPVGVVGVLLANGDGSFQPAVTYPSGGSVLNSVMIADLNGDGKPDLIVANEVESTVGVLMGNGDGSFQTVVTYASGAYAPKALAMSDVNGDGRLDVLVMNLCASGCDNIFPPQGTVGVLLGRGDGRLRKAVTYPSGGYFSFAIAAADLNGDGHPDLVVSNLCNTNPQIANCSDPGKVGVLLGNGDGSFQPVVLFGGGGIGLRAVAVADVNGDGKPDVLTGNCGSDGCGSFWPPRPGAVDGVLLGNGNGSFQAAVGYGSGTYFSVAAADVDGDGKLDLVSANWSCASGGTGCLAVMLGNGNGTFRSPLPFDAGPLPNAVAAADLNGDGGLDLIATHGFGNGLSLPPGTVDVLMGGPGLSNTTTTVTGSPNPALPRQNVTYTATVTTQSGGVPTGTVTFRDFNTVLGTSQLVVNTALIRVPHYGQDGLGFTHSITAEYSGDTDNDPSTSAPWLESVKWHSAMDMHTSGSPSLVGQPVTFTATPHSNGQFMRDGELVSFFDGKTLLGTIALAGGNARLTTSALTAKHHTIRASYPGDQFFDASTNSVAQIVNRYSTTVTLTSNPNPSAMGQGVTFKATVNPSGPFTPTGRVKILDGSAGIAIATLNNGVATITKSGLAAGTHAITAQYLGDAQSDVSTSSVLNQVVNP